MRRRGFGAHGAWAAAALAILMAATLAGASNMAFRVHIVVPRPPSCGVCDTWISLPFSNRFVGTSLRALCDSNGDGAVTTIDQIAIVSQQGGGFGMEVDPTKIDSLRSHVCSGPTIPEIPPYQPTRGVRLRAKTGTGNLSVLYYGTDVPGTPIVLRATASSGGTCAGSVCDNWVDLPYHTTAARLRDLCDSNGDGAVTALDAVQLVSQQGVPSNPDAVDTLTTHNCTGPPTINSPPVQIGRAVRIRLKAGQSDLVHLPPHF